MAFKSHGFFLYCLALCMAGGHKDMSSILASSYTVLYEPREGAGRGEGCGVLTNEYSCAHGVK